MSDMIEKLGIAPIVSHRFYADVNAKTSESYCKADDVRELEQQQNELIEALIDCIKRFENYEMSVDDDPPYYHKQAIKQYKSIIEKADSQHRSWNEIKEMYQNADKNNINLR